MQNNQLRKNNKGVTLVEVIAVIAVLGVVMAAVTGFMITSARMSAQVSNAATVTGRQQAAVEFINQRIWEADTVKLNVNDRGEPQKSWLIINETSDLVTVWNHDDPNLSKIMYNGVELCTGVFYVDEIEAGFVSYYLGDTMHKAPLKANETAQAAVSSAMDFINERLQEAVTVVRKNETTLLIDGLALTTQNGYVTYNEVQLCDGEIHFSELNNDTVEYNIDGVLSGGIELVAKKAAEVALDAATTFIAEKFASVESANVSISEVTIKEETFLVCKIVYDNPEDDNPAEEFLFQTVLDEFEDPIVVCNDKKICEGTICFVESIDNNTVTYFLNEIKYEASLKTTETEPPAAGASEQE